MSSDRQSQENTIRLYEEYYTPNDAKLVMMPRRKGAVYYYYCVFANGPFLSLLNDVHSGSKLLFYRLCNSLILNAGNVASFHIDTLCKELDVTKPTLYNSIADLKKHNLIKKWKTGKYALNPYCVWAYDQGYLEHARQLWDSWDVLSKAQIDDIMTLIGTRKK